MRLPERARLVLLLVSLGDYGYDEVAALLDAARNREVDVFAGTRPASALADRELAPAGSQAT